LYKFGVFSTTAFTFSHRLRQAANTLAASVVRTVRKAKFDKHLQQRGKTCEAVKKKHQPSCRQIVDV